MNASSKVNLVEPTDINSTPIFQDNLFPESVEYNPKTEQFLLSSLTEGTIFATNNDGSVSPFIEDERFISTGGLAIDEKQDRLYITNSDLGVSIKSSPETENQLATVGVYELSTGNPIDYVDLSSLRPGQPHLANDIDVDDEGNTYITDSFSPIIYKVDPTGNPSILLEDEQFAGEGFNLNGIVAHPDDFLLVADSNDGLLYKVPLDDPEQFTQVEIDRTLVNADGLLLGDENELIVVTNKLNDLASNQVLNLQSHDNWQSAEIVEQLDLDNNAFTTTATTKDEEILVLDAQVDLLLAGETTDEFAILNVGSIDSQNQVLTVGDFSITFDAERRDSDASGLLIRDNVDLGITLFEIGHPDELRLGSDGVLLDEADLLLAPELATALNIEDGAGEDVGDIRLHADASLEDLSLKIGTGITSVSLDTNLLEEVASLKFVGTEGTVDPAPGFDVGFAITDETDLSVGLDGVTGAIEHLGQVKFEV